MLMRKHASMCMPIDVSVYMSTRTLHRVALSSARQALPSNYVDARIDMHVAMPIDIQRGMHGTVAKPSPRRSISAVYWYRRRHVHCAGMGVPVLKMTASPRRSF